MIVVFDYNANEIVKCFVQRAEYIHESFPQIFEYFREPHMTAPYLCRFKTTRSNREWTWSKVSLIVRPNQTFYFRLRFE